VEETNMRSYATNCEELQQFLEEKGLENQTIGLLSPSLENQQKVLGIRWDNGSDKFQFEPSSIVQASQEIGYNITKRKILSISAKIFNSIGFLAPTVWDQVAPEEIQRSWKTLMNSMIEFNQLKIPR
jgi:hypothetical protein